MWGPPLSGQRRWIARSLAETDPQINTEAWTCDPAAGHESMTSLLDRLEKTLQSRSSATPYHLYCEIPWSALQEADEIEEWLAKRPNHFARKGAGGAAPWNLSFVGVAPWNGQKLPLEYRNGLEEFARASQSSIIVPSVDGNHDLPEWLGGDRLDFGHSIEVFDDPVWSDEAIKSRVPLSFGDEELFETLSIPIPSFADALTPLSDALCSGFWGRIWAAEAMWRTREGQVECLTMYNDGLYLWNTTHRDFLNMAPVNGGILQVFGAGLNLHLLSSTLKPKFS